MCHDKAECWTKFCPDVGKGVKVLPGKPSQQVAEPTAAGQLAVEVSILIQLVTQQG